MATPLLLAETDVLFCAGVAHALREQQEFELRLPELRNQHDLIATLRNTQNAIALVADGLIHDLTQLAQVARERAGSLVLLTGRQHTVPFSELPAIRGALRYSADARQLLACLRAVAAGERWYAPSPVNSRATPGARVLQTLSPRQLKVMADVARGAKNVDIAKSLGTSEQVVKNMLGSIYDVTGVSDRLELALFVLHHPELAQAAQAESPVDPG